MEPDADHLANETSVQELAPAREEDPAGHTMAALEPEGQYDPAGHAFVVPIAWPATQK
jgi:hypothetical protein